MSWFLLESNRRFCAIFRRQVQKSCRETAGRLFIEDGVVVITNEKSASVHKSGPPGRKTACSDNWIYVSIDKALRALSPEFMYRVASARGCKRNDET